jgi:hypothetical protein
MVIRAIEGVAMQEEDVHTRMYTVASVEKAASPKGMPGNNWHRYVIEFGDSTIEGLKPGTLTAVTEHAQSVADDLNERKNQRGSTYAPRSRRGPKR